MENKTEHNVENSSIGYIGFLLSGLFGFFLIIQFIIDDLVISKIINSLVFIISIILAYIIFQKINKFKYDFIGLRTLLNETLNDFENKIAEETKKKNQELADLIPQVVYELDSNYRLTFTNNAAYKLFGIKEDAVSKHISVIQLFAPEDQQKMAQNLNKRMNEGYNNPQEYTVLRKDGVRIPVMIFGTPILKDGNVVGTRGLIVDISERKAYESALIRSEERYKKLISSLQEGLFVIQNQKFVFLNDAIVKIVGYQIEELLNKEFLTIIAPESQEIVLRNYVNRINGLPAPNSYQVNLLHKNNESIPVILSVNISDYDNRPAIIGTAKPVGGEYKYS